MMPQCSNCDGPEIESAFRSQACNYAMNETQTRVALAIRFFLAWIGSGDGDCIPFCTQAQAWWFPADMRYTKLLKCLSEQTIGVREAGW